MKYWLFDGSDIIGPFTLQELAGRKGFSATSLVCPDGFSDQADHWQMASTFAELQPVLNGEVPAPETWEKEVDTLMKQGAPAEEDETPTTRESALHIPQTPSKAGPIEEYFNTIKGEDLGNILGIPDPNENTDADLARVIEKELGSMPEQEVYESLRKPLPQPQPKTKPAPAQGSPQAQSQTETPKPAAKPVKKAVSKNASKPAAKPVAKPAAKPAPQSAEAPLTRDPDSPEGIRIIDLDDKKPSASAKPAQQKTVSGASKKQAAMPKKAVPAKKEEVPSQKITKNEVEIEKFDTGGHQEELGAYRDPDQEEETQTLQEPPQKPHARSQWLMAVLACLLLFVLVRVLIQPDDYVKEIEFSAKDVADEIWSAWHKPQAALSDMAGLVPAQDTAAPVEQALRSTAGSLVLPPKVFPNEEADLRSPYAEPDAEDSPDLSITEGVPLTPAQTALVAVQQYELPNGRGKIKDYLQSYYAAQFAKGYEADWSVALLHRNT